MARYKNYNDGQHYFDIIDLENDLGSLAIDGTKLHAYASLYETKDRADLKKSINLLSKKMEKTLARLNSAETKEEDGIKKLIE